MSAAAEIFALVEGHPQATFTPGAVLMEEGERGGVLYVLDSGSVEVVKGGHAISHVSQRGAVFGEVSVLLNQPHMATVRAATETRCWAIADPRTLLGQHPRLALHVATMLARRLSAVTSYLVDLKRQYEDRQDHLCMVDAVLESLLQLQARPGPATKPDPSASTASR